MENKFIQEFWRALEENHKIPGIFQESRSSVNYSIGLTTTKMNLTHKI